MIGAFLGSGGAGSGFGRRRRRCRQSGVKRRKERDERLAVSQLGFRPHRPTTPNRTRRQGWTPSKQHWLSPTLLPPRASTNATLRRKRWQLAASTTCRPNREGNPLPLHVFELPDLRLFSPPSASRLHASHRRRRCGAAQCKHGEGTRGAKRESRDLALRLVAIVGWWNDRK